MCDLDLEQLSVRLALERKPIFHKKRGLEVKRQFRKSLNASCSCFGTSHICLD